MGRKKVGMVVFYDFYLDKRSKGSWSSILINDKDVILSLKGVGMSFLKYSSYFYVSFAYLSKEFQAKHREKYFTLNEIERRARYNFCEMDLKRMLRDYDLGVHEFSEIISKSDYKRLLLDRDYNPTTIDAKTYGALNDAIKNHYVFHEWDSSSSEYLLLYELVPLVRDVSKQQKIGMNDLRLLCRMC